LKIQREATDRQKKADQENTAKVMKLQMELNLLVKSHKIEISELCAKMESQRKDFVAQLI